METPNTSSTLIEILAILGVLLLIVCLILIIKIYMNSKNKDTKQTSDLNIENLKLLFDTQGDANLHNFDVLMKTMQSANAQLLNYLQNYFSNQSQATNNVETRIKELLNKNENQLNRIDDNLKSNLHTLQTENSKKLEEMRITVDEKLNVSLERRLNESFALISDRLDKVHRGLGEMQELATGVGDLKKVLTNVKTRGIWGEISLGNILEQMLAPNQFAEQIAVNPESRDRVDFVVILPGKDDKNIYLPIDSKFPIEDYQRLIDASDRADINEMEKARTALYKRVKEEAKKIHDKYVCPPNTTDFAVLYLALEGLYAEVIKDSELVQQLQRDYRIVVCGPTTLTALINSLQMGFKTVAIEKRSSEIWALLSTFKTEFVKFVELLGKTQKKLNEASGTIEDATKKTKKIQRKLNNIGVLDGYEEDEMPLITDEEE